MKVFKFGGASVKDAAHIFNVKEILESYKEEKIVVVVSAMGKTTNALEKVVDSFLNEGNDAFKLLLGDIVNVHLTEVEKLNLDNRKTAFHLNAVCEEAFKHLSNIDLKDKSAVYDQIVSLGELFSSIILESYISEAGLNSHWIDIRDVIKTDNRFQEGVVDFESTEENAVQIIKSVLKQKDIVVTQGFLGQSPDGLTTTLGREGSDYTGAILAYCLNVNEMSVWKDVPGILTADPRRFENVEKLDRMSYKEAIEMTYYGAKVIHPKTIRPLQNKGIQLHVKSFIKPKDNGTVIASDGLLNYPPLVVIEDDMVLLHISSNDFSFIAEDHLSQIFIYLNKNRIKLRTMRNSAISFSICVKNPGSEKLEQLINDLGQNFTLDIYKNLQLINVRYFNKDLIQRLTKNKVVLFEERMKYTIQLVVRPSLELIEKKPGSIVN